MSLFDLTGRVSLVTGGAMGIGRAAAIALAMGGADIVVADLDVEVGNKTAATLRELGRDALFVECDVTDPQQVRAMVDAVARHFGRLDIAVNNAGVLRRGTDGIHSTSDWDYVIGVNLTGVWLCAVAEMQQMITQTPTAGKIINIASIAAGFVCADAPYDASKAGVVQLTRTLASEWGRFNINVNSVSPGYVIAVLGGTRSLQEREEIRKITPLGHIQRLEDLYGPILFLASSASDFVTGHNLLVDGGVTLPRLTPLEREAPPRVDPAAEVIELNKDLDARGVAHDQDGIILDTTEKGGT